ncbi:hypothetical protein [Rathayibacter sp. AY1C5]|uniref:hypothetical protein n=1 Tax=Rathayibacter sp. AY1C5 TaxID=2080538 RepID=UPI0011B0F3C3|nr:hypothetical protein [Rathayibacter sp. AY1C5]
MRRKYGSAFAVVLIPLLLSGCGVQINPEALQDDASTSDGSAVGVDASDEMISDPEGNWLSISQMDSRNSIVEICTNAEDALKVKGAWIYREEPSSFEAALLLALDGKAASPARPGLPSRVQAQPAGMAHLAEVAASCADVVSTIQYVASVEKTDEALAARSTSGATEPDFAYLSSLVAEITKQE